jgi:type II secretory pathway component GspD/PulD (secretin)
MISIDLQIVEVTRPARGEAEASESSPNGNPASQVPAVDEFEGLDGDGDKVLAKIRELEQRRQLSAWDRVRLTTVDNQAATVQFGKRIAVVQGSQLSRLGGRVNSYSYENVGLMVNVTTRIVQEDAAPHKAIVMELVVEKSDLRTAEKAPAESGEREPVPSTTVTMISKTTLSVPDGETLVVGGMRSQSGVNQSQTLIIVTARIIEPAKPQAVQADTKP